MGGSNGSYLALAGAMGHWKELADEVWTINGSTPLITHHRAFVMDDVKHILTDQAALTGKEERKVAQGILKWLPDHPGPVYSTTAYPEWPALVEYPMGAVLEAIGGAPYLTNSVAYAVAFALMLNKQDGRVCSTISLFGCDFNYPGQTAFEPGRGSVEFLLGMACARGINIELPDSTTLMDGNVPMHKKLYGFHEPVRPITSTDGRVSLLRGEAAKRAATS